MEDPGFDDDALLADDGAAADPETDDPLASLSEDTRALVEGVLTQREQAAAAAARDEEQKRFRRASGRWGHASQVLGEQLGLTVDDSGNVATADPQKLASYTARFLGGAAAPTPAEPDEPLDIYNPERLEQQIQARATKLAASEVDARMAPLLERLDRLTGYVGQQGQPQATDHARGWMKEIGQEELADTQEFQQVFQQTLAGVPFEQRSDPAQIEAAAAFSMAHARRLVGGQRGQRTSTPPPSPRAAANAVSRAGLSQIGGSRDTGQRPQESQYGDDVKASLQVLRDNGVTMSDAEFVAAMGQPARDGRSAYHDYLDKQKKGRR